jgi:hypothetical protein
MRKDRKQIDRRPHLLHSQDSEKIQKGIQEAGFVSLLFRRGDFPLLRERCVIQLTHARSLGFFFERRRPWIGGVSLLNRQNHYGMRASTLNVAPPDMLATRHTSSPISFAFAEIWSKCEAMFSPGTYPFQDVQRISRIKGCRF